MIFPVLALVITGNIETKKKNVSTSVMHLKYEQNFAEALVSINQFKQFEGEFQLDNLLKKLHDEKKVGIDWHSSPFIWQKNEIEEINQLLVVLYLIFMKPKFCFSCNMNAMCITVQWRVNASPCKPILPSCTQTDLTHYLRDTIIANYFVCSSCTCSLLMSNFVLVKVRRSYSLRNSQFD